MRVALYYFAKIRRENAELQVQVQAMESVWSIESFTRGVSWLRRRLQNLDPKVK
jgi:hypothetical protein